MWLTISGRLVLQAMRKEHAFSPVHQSKAAKACDGDRCGADRNLGGIGPVVPGRDRDDRIVACLSGPAERDVEPRRRPFRREQEAQRLRYPDGRPRRHSREVIGANAIEIVSATTLADALRIAAPEGVRRDAYVGCRIETHDALRFRSRARALELAGRKLETAGILGAAVERASTGARFETMGATWAAGRVPGNERVYTSTAALTL